jgi:hypothetical protein
MVLGRREPRYRNQPQFHVNYSRMEIGLQEAQSGNVMVCELTLRSAGLIKL